MGDLISREEAFASLERIREANKAGYYDGLAYWEIERWLDILPSAEKSGKWIPCSERLPEETGFYLVTLRTRWDDGVECGPSEDIEVRKMHFSLVDEWTLSAYIPMDDSDLDQHVQQEVLAWMPLPEPYKGVG